MRKFVILFVHYFQKASDKVLNEIRCLKLSPKLDIPLSVMSVWLDINSKESKLKNKGLLAKI